MNLKKLARLYTEFRRSQNFQMKPIERDGSKIYFMGQLVEDEDRKYLIGEGYIDIFSGAKNELSAVLSNLFPIEFNFRGKKVASIEGVLQGIKYKDKQTQNLILNYSGLSAHKTRAANTQKPWFITNTLYWQGKAIDRNSEEYQEFLDELYVSALTNPIYRQSLIATDENYLLHHIGRDSETVLTRFEYEERLNTLREFAKILYKGESNEKLCDNSREL